MTKDTKELWSWMTEYPDGTVGMVGAMFKNNHTPLIGRSQKYIRGFKPLAEEHKRLTGQRVWLRRWVLDRDEPDL